MQVPCRHFTSVHGKGQFTRRERTFVSPGFPWTAWAMEGMRARLFLQQKDASMHRNELSQHELDSRAGWIRVNFFESTMCGTRSLWNSQVNHLPERDTANTATSMGEGAPGPFLTGGHVNLQKSGSSAAAGLVVTEAEAAVANPGVVRAAAAAAAEAAEAACGAAANENEKLQLVWNFVKPWTFHCSTPNFFSMFRLVHRDSWINNCSWDTVLVCYAIWSLSKDCVTGPKTRELACM